jgi:hypothetical protein
MHAITPTQRGTPSAVMNVDNGQWHLQAAYQ